MRANGSFFIVVVSLTYSHIDHDLWLLLANKFAVMSFCQFFTRFVLP